MTSQRRAERQRVEGAAHIESRRSLRAAEFRRMALSLSEATEGSTAARGVRARIRDMNVAAQRTPSQRRAASCRRARCAVRRGVPGVAAPGAQTTAAQAGGYTSGRCTVGCGCHRHGRHSPRRVLTSAAGVRTRGVWGRAKAGAARGICALWICAHRRSRWRISGDVPTSSLTIAEADERSTVATALPSHLFDSLAA
jgi:hypothetical protein